MAEMTAATEEYFVEIQRLRRLLLIERQCTAKASSADLCPAEGAKEGDAEEEVRSPSRYCASLRDRVSGVADTTRSHSQGLGPDNSSFETDGKQRDRLSKGQGLAPEPGDRASPDCGFAGQGARRAQQAREDTPTTLGEEVRREYQQRSGAPVGQHVATTEISGGDAYQQVSGKGRRQGPPRTTQKVLPARPSQVPTRAVRAARAAAAAAAVGGGGTNPATAQTSRKARTTRSSLNPGRSDHKNNSWGKGHITDVGFSGGFAAERLVLASAGRSRSGYGEARSRGRPLSAPFRRPQAEESPQSSRFLRNKQQRPAWRRVSPHARVSGGGVVREGRRAGSLRGGAIREDHPPHPPGGQRDNASSRALPDDDDNNSGNSEGWSRSSAPGTPRREADRADGDEDGALGIARVEEKTVSSARSKHSCRGEELGWRSPPHEAGGSEGRLTARSTALDTRSEEEQSRLGRTENGIPDDAQFVDEHHPGVRRGLGRQHTPAPKGQVEGERVVNGPNSASASTGHTTSNATGVRDDRLHEKRHTVAGDDGGGGGDGSGGEKKADAVAIEQTNVVPPVVPEGSVAGSSGGHAAAVAASTSGVKRGGGNGRGAPVESWSDEEEYYNTDKAEFEEDELVEEGQVAEEDEVVEEDEVGGEEEVVEEEEEQEQVQEKYQEQEREREQEMREEDEGENAPPAPTAHRQRASLDHDNGNDSDTVYNVELSSPRVSLAGEKDVDGHLSVVMTDDEKTSETPDDILHNNGVHDPGSGVGDTKNVLEEEKKEEDRAAVEGGEEEKEEKEEVRKGEVEEEVEVVFNALFGTTVFAETQTVNDVVLVYPRRK